jgi:hypothetical protein
MQAPSWEVDPSTSARMLNSYATLVDVELSRDVRQEGVVKRGRQVGSSSGVVKRGRQERSSRGVVKGSRQEGSSTGGRQQGVVNRSLYCMLPGFGGHG